MAHMEMNPVKCVTGMTDSLKMKGSCKCSGEDGESVCGWNRKIQRYTLGCALKFVEQAPS